MNYCQKNKYNDDWMYTLNYLPRGFCAKARLIVHFNAFTSRNFKRPVYPWAFWMGFQLHKWSPAHEKQYCVLKRRRTYCAAHMGLSGPIGYQQLPLKWKILFVSKNCLSLKENLCSPPIIPVSRGLYCWELYTIYMQKMTMTPVCSRTPRVSSLRLGCLSWHRGHQNLPAMGGTGALLFLDSCFCPAIVTVSGNLKCLFLPDFRKEKKNHLSQLSRRLRKTVITNVCPD